MQVSHDRGVDCHVLRYVNTYGTRQTLSPYVGVITIFTHRVLDGEAPVIFGYGERGGGWSWIDGPIPMKHLIVTGVHAEIGKAIAGFEEELGGPRGWQHRRQPVTPRHDEVCRT